MRLSWCPRIVLFYAILCTLGLWARTALAQPTEEPVALNCKFNTLTPSVRTASVNITAVDRNGTPIPIARVSLQAPEFTCVSRTSSLVGSFKAGSLPYSTATLTVIAEGFSIATLPITVAKPAMSIRVVMGIRPVIEEIEVHGNVADVASLVTSSRTFDEADISITPAWLNDLNNLIVLAAGVTPRPSDEDRGLGLSAAGSRTTTTNFELDGAPNRSDRSGGAIISPVFELVQSVQVVNQDYSAASGHTPGLQVRLDTKSGGNEIHGALYDYNRDHYGAQIGGPIKRNDLYYFAGIEGQNAPVNDDGFTSYLPSKDWLSGSFGVPSSAPAKSYASAVTAGAIHPISSAFLKFLPSSQKGGATYFADEIRSSGMQVLTRIDRVQPTHKSFLRLGMERVSTSMPFSPLHYYGNLPGFGAGTLTSSLSGAFGDSRAFSDGWLNDFRAAVSFQRERSQPTSAQSSIAETLHIPVEQLPRIVVSGVSPFGTALPQEHFSDPAINLQETVTLDVRSHHITAGAQSITSHFTQRSLAPKGGTFLFDGTFSGNAFWDFLSGVPAGAVIETSAPVSRWAALTNAIYLQDGWRVTPGATLTFGLRYDLLSPYSCPGCNLSSFEPSTGRVLPVKRLTPHYDTIAPRIGFTFAPFPNRSLVLKGGAGVFYFREDAQFVTEQLAHNYPDLVDSYYSANTLTGPLPFSTDGLSTYPVRTNSRLSSGYQITNPTPVTYHYSLKIEAPIKGSLVSIAYIGSQSHHLGRRYNVNAPRFTGSYSSTSTPLLQRPFAAFDDVIYQDQEASSNFNSAEIGIRHQGKRFRGEASYTFSRSIDDASASAAAYWTSTIYAQDPANLAAERGLSDFHHAHALKASMSYRTANSQHWFARNISSSMTWMAFSGRPFTPWYSASSSTSYFEDRHRYSYWLRPDVISDPFSNIPNGYWFNPNAFVPHVVSAQSPTAFGNTPRNAFLGPANMTMNLAFARTFTLRNGLRITPTLQLFNLFDGHDYDIPDVYLGPTFGELKNHVYFQRQACGGLRIEF